MSRPEDKRRSASASKTPGVGVSRRGFLKSAGITAAAVGVTGPAAAAQNHKVEEDVTVYGPGVVGVPLQINGKKMTVEVEPATTLLDVLRDHIDLTGTKKVCDQGACGACTVLIDGRPRNACLTLVIDAIGRDVRTVESFSADGKMSKLQEAFVSCDASQCGFCTPGMVVACTALIEKNPKPSRDEVKEAIAGNICRCGTYQNIFEAVDVATGQGGSQR